MCGTLPAQLAQLAGLPGERRCPQLHPPCPSASSAASAPAQAERRGGGEQLRHAQSERQAVGSERGARCHRGRLAQDCPAAGAAAAVSTCCALLPAAARRAVRSPWYSCTIASAFSTRYAAALSSAAGGARSRTGSGTGRNWNSALRGCCGSKAAGSKEAGGKEAGSCLPSTDGGQRATSPGQASRRRQGRGVLTGAVVAAGRQQAAHALFPRRAHRLRGGQPRGKQL